MKYVLILLCILVFFQNCGNVSVSQAPSQGSGSEGNSQPSPVGAPPASLGAQLNCERKADYLVNLINTQIPTGKVLYNNYFTNFLVLGDDLVVLSNYSYGNAISQNQPVTGATGVVEAKYITAEGVVTNINLPTIPNYSWNNEAGNAVGFCYIADAKSNSKNEAYVLIFCNHQNNAIGFKSLIYTLDNSKTFRLIASSNQMHNAINLNKQNELIFIETNFDRVKSIFNYQLYKYSNSTIQKIGNSFSSEAFKGLALTGVIFETENSEYAVFLRDGALAKQAFYFPNTNQLNYTNWSKTTREIIQSLDDKALYYFSFDYGVGKTNTLFKIDAGTLTESKQSDDVRYIYNYQAHFKNVITKIGSEYNSIKGKAWISYDKGINFSEIINSPTQSNQFAQTLKDKFYLLGVDTYSNGQIKASIYSLNCVK